MAGGSHQGIGGVDASDMSAFYALENAGHRRYYSAGYGPHGEFECFFIIQLELLIYARLKQFNRILNTLGNFMKTYSKS